MSLIQQRCPGCDRNLQLPADAIGKTARCPACEITFEVLPPPERLPADLVARPAPPIGARSFGTPSSGSDSSVPVSPRYNPLTIDPGTTSSPTIGAGGTLNPLNPYQSSSTAGSSIVRVGEFEVRDVGFGDVLNTSWEIFKARWGHVILAGVISGIVAAAILFAGLMVSAVVLQVLSLIFNTPNQQAAGALVGFVTILFFMIFGVFFAAVSMAWIGTAWSSMLIAVAQGHPEPLSQFKLSWQVTRRVVSSTTLLLVCAFAVFFFLLIGSAILSNVGLAEAVGVIAAVVAFLVYSFGHSIFQFFMWPWLFTLANKKSTAVGSLRAGYMLAMHNKANSVLLVIAYLALTILGFLLLIVGLLLTFPFARLISTVTYLMTTNQDVIGFPRVATEN